MDLFIKVILSYWKYLYIIIIIIYIKVTMDPRFTCTNQPEKCTLSSSGGNKLLMTTWTKRKPSS